MPLTTLYSNSIEDEISITVGKPVKININKDGSKILTLYPAKDGIHITKAVITWLEPDKDFQRGSMKHITRDVENSITIDNLSGGGSLKITPKQYYVARDRPSYVPYFFKQHLGQHGL
jgi:hypothetical protein